MQYVLTVEIEDYQRQEFLDLSCEARGLLTLLWSREEEEVYRDDLLFCTGWGEDRLKKVTDELKEAGYLFFGRFRCGEKFNCIWLVSTWPRSKQDFINSRTYQELIVLKGLEMNEAETQVSPPKTENPESPDVLQRNTTIVVSVNNSDNNCTAVDVRETPDYQAQVQKPGSRRRALDHSHPAYTYAVLQLEEVKKGPYPNEQLRRRDTPEKEENYLQRQAEHFEKLIRLDKIELPVIEKVLFWLYQGQGPEARFWRRQVRAGEKFRAEFYRLLDTMNFELGDTPTTKQDPNPELTKEMIGVFRRLTDNPGYKPDGDAKEKFIEASSRCERFFRRREQCERKDWADLLLDCLDRQYCNMSENVYPGHMCSNFTWEILMPQYISQSGLNC